MPRARTLLPVLAAAIALAIAGCASSSNGTGSGGAQSGGGGGNATVAFVTPATGATVSSPVDVGFKVTGAQIGQPETGKMHFHVYVDQSNDYKILYTMTGKVDVPAGQHTLKVVLAQPNHTETSTTATQRITVSGSGAGQAPATTSSGGGGYGYP